MRIRLFAGMLCVFGCAGIGTGQDIFNDENLQALVEATLWVSDPTPVDMLAVTSLYGGHRGIDSLAGLEYAANLQELNLQHNDVSDLSPLSDLMNLTAVRFNTNSVGDLTPLSDLTGLRLLDFHDNFVTDVSALSELTALESLTMHGNPIGEVSSLSGLVNLELLRLDNTGISSISPLAGLTELRTFGASVNTLSDISVLAGMTELEYVNLYSNDITDISALAGLDHLRYVNVSANQISDVSALTSLTSLTYVDLRGNPLGTDAYSRDIPLIAANNPGVSLNYNAPGQFEVKISSTIGGGVIQPGLGSFRYDAGDLLTLEAEAENGYAFVGWSGTFESEQNPASLLIHSNHAIEAVFLPVGQVFYVDDDASNDPAPGDAGESDPHENGTAARPYDSIQEAIDTALDGDRIVVRPGTYRESINLSGKAIRLTGLNPDGNPLPVIEGDGTNPTVSFVSAEDANCIVTGLAITSGHGKQAAVVCRDSSPVLTNCLIAGNRATATDGAAVYCVDSNALLDNCTIADNAGGPQGGGMVLIDSRVILTNSIVWANTPNQIIRAAGDESVVTYSDIQGGWPGVGNIDAAPSFVRRGVWLDPDDPNALWQDGDYHLMSRAGRWDATSLVWLEDAVTSLCIDGGDPAAAVLDEPRPNGELVNMGVYGATVQASKSDSR